jgi:hypothetical protein
MCSAPSLIWFIANANLMAGLLGAIGSILLAVPSFLSSGLRRDAMEVEAMRTRLIEPHLIDPLQINALERSIAFLDRERRWMRAGALCLLVSFVLMSLDAACRS